MPSDFIKILASASIHLKKNGQKLTVNSVSKEIWCYQEMRYRKVMDKLKEVNTEVYYEVLDQLDREKRCHTTE